MSQFDFSGKMQAITRLSLVLLGVAAIASTSPVRAEDQSPQQAALQTEPAVETGQVLNLDSSFLSRETDAWHSDAEGFSVERQARIESCYLAAESAYRAGIWDGGFGSDTDDMDVFEYGVSDFYAGQQRKSQFGKCMQ
ncbi:MAG: hypothetical protein QNJ30_26560 [Kiloniellales bacterium]|nr:hypothetical protein [Kiloniellales bacterium]